MTEETKEPFFTRLKKWLNDFLFYDDEDEDDECCYDDDDDTEEC